MRRVWLSPTLRRAPRWAAALLACACSHGEPWPATASMTDNEPITLPSGIQQLTLGTNGDWAATWLPDGQTIAFSWKLPEAADGDRCLAFMSMSSFRIGRTLCVGRTDSTEVVVSSAVSAGGRLAVVAETSPRNLPLSHRNLYIGHADGSGPLVPVLTLPVSMIGGFLHPSMEQLAWQSESVLVYVATAPRNIRTDLQSSPLQIGFITLHGWTALTGQVGNTLGASSVAIDQNDGAVYATFVGDARVYRIAVPSGQRQLVLDLAAFGFPRDVRVSSGHLAAVVKGRQFPVDSTAYGVTTWQDEGGELVLADLTGGGAPVFYQKPFTWFRRLTLSPDGQHLVAEGYPVTYIPIGPCCPAPEDTVVTKVSDLWLIQWP